MHVWVPSTSRFAKRPGWKAEASPNKNSEDFSRKLLFPGHWVNSETNCANMGNFYLLFLYCHSKKTRVWVHLFQSRASGFQLILTWQWAWLSELSVEHLHRKWRPQLFSLISLQTDSVLWDKRSLTESATSPFSWNTLAPLPQWPPIQITPSLVLHHFRLWRKLHLEMAQLYDAKPPAQLALVSRAQLGNTTMSQMLQVVAPTWVMVHPLGDKLNCDY